MTNMNYGLVTHPYKPLFNNHSKVLILGTIASLASRKNGFYYTHPQNRFWKVMAKTLTHSTPETIEEKKDMLLTNKVALWDVLSSAYIKGSSDSTIKNPVANDINFILQKADISAIFTTGKKAFELYKKLCYPTTLKEAFYLPSTSPANATYTLDNLFDEYSIINKYLKDKL